MLQINFLGREYKLTCVFKCIPEIDHNGIKVN